VATWTTFGRSDLKRSGLGRDLDLNLRLRLRQRLWLRLHRFSNLGYARLTFSSFVHFSYFK